MMDMELVTNTEDMITSSAERERETNKKRECERVIKTGREKRETNRERRE